MKKALRRALMRNAFEDCMIENSLARSVAARERFGPKQKQDGGEMSDKPKILTEEEKQKILAEAIGKISRLAEGVRYRPNGLLPSEIQGEFQSTLDLVKTGFGDSAPAGWSNVVDTARLFLNEAAKPQRIPGCVEHFHRLIEEGCTQVVGADEARRVNDNLLATGRAVRRVDWQKMAPQASIDFFKSGGIVID
jgi:hypothetical protein